MTKDYFICLTHDQGYRTCDMPQDEDEVEVLLEDGTIHNAFYYCLGFEEWGFTGVPAIEGLDDPDEIENVIAWRPKEYAAIDAQFVEDKFDWSLDTFGVGQRVKGVTDHIIREAIEARENPKDASEWADIILLAMDGASRSGISGKGLITAILNKQAANRKRQWPAPETQDPDRAIEHVREANHDK